MLTSLQRQELIEKIKAFPAQLKAVVTPLTGAQLTAPDPEGGWTAAQIVHHLADSHVNSYIRLKLILTEEQPTLKPYDQEAWAGLADGDTPAIEDSLAILEGLHRRWTRLFESLGEADWQRSGFHPEIGPVTPEDLLRIYAGHGADHLDQMRRVLAA